MRGTAVLRRRGPRVLVSLLAVFAPRALRRWMFVRLLGHDIHPDAYLGRSLIDVDQLVMEAGSVIGPLNIIRGCDLVHLERDAKISALNWINAVRLQPDYFVGVERHPALVMRRASLITTLHLLDASDTIEFGPFSALAGFMSLVQTHAVDVVRLAQDTEPVRIGHHSLIASRCTLLPGAVVPDTAIVAGGAVIAGELHGTNLFAGVPAKAVKALDPLMPIFTRTQVEVS